MSDLIARLRQASAPTVEWRVVNTATDGIVVWFDDTWAGERQAREWLADVQRVYPRKFDAHVVQRFERLSQRAQLAHEAADELERLQTDRDALAKDGPQVPNGCDMAGETRFTSMRTAWEEASKAASVEASARYQALADLDSARAEVERLKQAWQPRPFAKCATHGPERPNEWGCPNCVAELRADVGRLKGAQS